MSADSLNSRIDYLISCVNKYKTDVTSTEQLLSVLINTDKFIQLRVKLLSAQQTSEHIFSIEYEISNYSFDAIVLEVQVSLNSVSYDVPDFTSTYDKIEPYYIHRIIKSTKFTIKLDDDVSWVCNTTNSPSDRRIKALGNVAESISFLMLLFSEITLSGQHQFLSNIKMNSKQELLESFIRLPFSYTSMASARSSVDWQLNHL